jgi:CheY-like chemotaxis protein
VIRLELPLALTGLLAVVTRSTARRAAASPAVPREALANRRRILVVDDNTDAAASLSELLELTGHVVHTVHDGPAALEAAMRLKPDAVLLDIGLPGMSGYDIAREIRGQPWGRDVLLVALTGWGQAKDRIRSREAGFDRHLVKPIDFAELEELLAAPRERPEA